MISHARRHPEIPPLLLPRSIMRGLTFSRHDLISCLCLQGVLIGFDYIVLVQLGLNERSFFYVLLNVAACCDAFRLSSDISKP